MPVLIGVNPDQHPTGRNRPKLLKFLRIVYICDRNHYYRLFPRLFLRLLNPF